MIHRCRQVALGICNGFQIMNQGRPAALAKVDTATAHRDATLAWNDNGRFETAGLIMRADSASASSCQRVR